MIEKLYIKGFGKYRDFEMDLDRGINLIYGFNESGKTTLMKFIHYMLYGMKKSNVKKKIYVEEYDRYKPWSYGPYGGTLILSLDGFRYRIDRDFSKENDWVRVYREDTGEDISFTFPMDDRKELLIMQKQMGMTENVFKSTVCVHSLSTSIHEAGGDSSLFRDINERMVYLLSSQKEDVSIKAALELIQKMLGEIGTERSKTKLLGTLLEQTDQYRVRAVEYSELLDIFLDKKKEKLELEEEIQSLSRKEDEIGFNIYCMVHKMIMLKEDQLDQHRSLLIEKETIYQRLKKGLSDFTQDTFQNFTEQFHSFREKLEELKQREKWISRANDDKENFLNEQKQFDKISDVHIPLEAVKAMERDFSRIHENSFLGHFDVLEREKYGIIAQRRAKAITAFAFLGAMVAFAVSGAVWNWALWGAAVLSAFFSMVFLKGTHRLSLELNHINEKIESQEKIYNQLHEDKRRLDKQIDEILGKTGNTNFMEFLEDFKRYHELGEKIIECNAIIDENDKWIHENGDAVYEFDLKLKRYFRNMDEPINDVDILDPLALQALYERFHDYDTMPAEMDSIKKHISSLKGEIDELYAEREQWYKEGFLFSQTEGGVDPRLLRCLKEEHDKVWEQQHELETKLAVQISKLTSLEENLNRFVDFESDREETETQLLNILELKKSLEEAASGLEEVSEEFQRDFIPSIANHMKHYLQQFTNGRYREVKFNKELNFKAQATDDSHLVSVEDLSSGTIDQIYLAFRIAAAEYLTGRKDLFFIMDDPFLQYDSKRKAKAIDTLAYLGKRHQFLLFTCQSDMESHVKKLNNASKIIQL